MAVWGSIILYVAGALVYTSSTMVPRMYYIMVDTLFTAEGILTLMLAIVVPLVMDILVEYYCNWLNPSDANIYRVRGRLVTLHSLARCCIVVAVCCVIDDRKRLSWNVGNTRRTRYHSLNHPEYCRTLPPHRYRASRCQRSRVAIVEIQ